MKKKLSAILLASAVVLSLSGCSMQSGSNNGGESNAGNVSNTVLRSSDSSAASAGGEGKVFNIYAWNEEFKGFFEKYYAGTTPVNDKAVKEQGAEPIYYDKAPGIPKGVTVNWIIKTSDGGIYQEKLDNALIAQKTAKNDDKVDMFLAEADYILKYTNSTLTMDIKELGLSQLPTQYQYTVSAASNSSGEIKGVSFQCCPAALIYRRSIAKDVLGTDDPDEVQSKLDSWDKFDAVAAKAKIKGYYMTASYVETFRTFSNNTTSPWVDAENNLVVDDTIHQYIKQAKTYMDNSYTLPAGVWSDEKNAQMFKDGKTMCFFGPAWYYNFSMGNAQDPDKGCYGDWAICQGPQPYFWGGTWLLAPVGTDNPTMLADIMRCFTENEDICSQLVENEGQFTNNSAVNEKYAADPNFGNAFLGGQNDTAIYVDLARNIRFENKTAYDQLLNEQLTDVFLDYFQNTINEEQAWNNFYQYVHETYPTIITP